MEDVEFTKSHSNSPLPEAGNDPADPLRPEIEEENSCQTRRMQTRTRTWR